MDVFNKNSKTNFNSFFMDFNMKRNQKLGQKIHYYRYTKPNITVRKGLTFQTNLNLQTILKTVWFNYQSVHDWVGPSHF